ncbi:MAG: hypothetical protein KGI97_05255 [Alphaproteobacteria bacterium]|nr:hypothetical protein [Alphaproteobacteria bacterium]
MTVSNISNLSLTQALIATLNGQSATLGDLSTQLATQQKHTDLTDYAPTDALNLVNLKASATQSQAYINVIDTVQARLSGYDTTMTDMESVVSQAQQLVTGNQSYNPATAASLAATAENYLKSVNIDLNQQISGRYIYAGSRYTTAPVADLTTLATAPSSTIVPATGLPNYDSAYTAPTLTTSATSNSVTIGGTVSTPQQVSVTVNNGTSDTTYTYTVQASDTTSTVAAGLAALIPGASSTGPTLNLGVGTTVTSTVAAMTSTAAYATDSAAIAAGYNVTYGVTSNDKAFQELVQGLRFLYTAANSGNAATYSTDIKQAESLLTSALTDIQAVHTTVANNINTLTNEKNLQNTAITSLTNQVDDIQNVNITQVSAEITALQTILQASYTVTGAIEKLSIASYL